MYIDLMKETLSDIIRNYRILIQYFTKTSNVISTGYNHKKSPTSVSAPGSKTEIIYVISSEKKEFAFVNCGNKT